MATNNVDYQWGYIDDQDESLQGSGGFGNFGLNPDVRVTKFEYNPNAGKDNSLADAIDIEVTVNDTVMRRRIYDVTRVFNAQGNEIGSNDPGYAEQYKKTMDQNRAVITHYAKSLGVTEQQMNMAFRAQQPTDFVSWSKAVISALPANFTQVPIDIFLEYQWNIPSGQTQTFLELPKNMKGGRFACPHIPYTGKWNERTSWINPDTGKQETGLSYVDDAGKEHPFKRNPNYMSSNKAIQQKADDSFKGADALQNVNAGSPAKVEW